MFGTKRPKSGSDGGSGFSFTGSPLPLHGGEIRIVKLPEPLRQLCSTHGSLSRCTAPYGSPELRQVFSETFNQATGFAPDCDALLVCKGGARMALQIALAALPRWCDLAAFSPMWFGFPQIVGQMQHGLFVGSVEQHGYKATAAALEAMLNAAGATGRDVRGVILNNLGTPAGRAWSRSEVQELGQLILGYPDLTVIEDCCFWRSAFPGQRFLSLGGECPELLERDQLIGVASMSKGWPLDELSLGFLWAHPRRMDALRRVSHSWELEPSDGLQHCAGDALVGSGRDLPGELSARLASNLAHLRALSEQSMFRLACVPDGGTNALLDVSDIVAGDFRGQAVCCEDCLATQLRKHVGVVLYPGSHFGCRRPSMRVNLAGCTAHEFRAATMRLQAFSDACG